MLNQMIAVALCALNPLLVYWWMQLSAVCHYSNTLVGYRPTPPCSSKSYLFSLLRDLGDTIPSCLQQDTHITTLFCMKVFISAHTTIHTHISPLFTHPADVYSCLLDDNPWLKNIPYNFYPDSSLLCLCTESGSARTEQALKLVIWLKNTGLFISPSGTSELDCATTKTCTAERSISIGTESLKVLFCTRGLGVLAGSTARG